MNATPDVSVIIPVLDEGEGIRGILAQLATVAESVCYEVIVVDGDAQGSTLQCLPKAPPQPVVSVQGLVAPQGRGSQMNAGAIRAKGDILLFLHADTQLPPQALTKLSQVLQSRTVAAGAFDLAIQSPRWALNWVGKIASVRSRLTRVPYGDQGIFIRREVFETCGGYPDIPIMEDVALMRQLKQRGYAIRILRDRVRVSPRRWEQEGILYCTLRNWVLVTLYTLGVSPHQLVAWYRPLYKHESSNHESSRVGAPRSSR